MLEVEISETSFEHPNNYYLLEALEIVSKDADLLEHFLAWGYLITDSEINRLQWETSAGAQAEKSVKEIVLAMAIGERRALRDRVRSQYEQATGFFR
jgi:hypothetical protein